MGRTFGTLFASWSLRYTKEALIMNVSIVAFEFHVSWHTETGMRLFFWLDRQGQKHGFSEDYHLKLRSVDLEERNEDKLGKYDIMKS